MRGTGGRRGRPQVVDGGLRLAGVLFLEGNDEVRVVEIRLQRNGPLQGTADLLPGHAPLIGQHGEAVVEGGVGDAQVDGLPPRFQGGGAILLAKRDRAERGVNLAGNGRTRPPGRGRALRPDPDRQHPAGDRLASRARQMRKSERLGGTRSGGDAGQRNGRRDAGQPGVHVAG